jgi:hypothetical protein
MLSVFRLGLIVLSVIFWHYVNTYKDYTYNDFINNIDRCDITYVLSIVVVLFLNFIML